MLKSKKLLSHLFLYLLIGLCCIFSSCNNNRNIDNDYSPPFEMPSKDNILLIYTESNIGRPTLGKYYLISGDGYIGLFDFSNNDYNSFETGIKVTNEYKSLNQYFLEDSKKLSIEPLDAEQLERLTMLNADNERIFVISEIKHHLIPVPRKTYYVMRGKDNVGFGTLCDIEYAEEFGKDIIGEERCIHPFATEFIDYIDYAVNEAKKAGL